jgi:ATP-dependent DNA helicase PIF1
MMMNNIIEATILNGKFKGEDVLLPRISMIPTDMPFEFKRLQFSVRIAFAMTNYHQQSTRAHYKCVD